MTRIVRDLFYSRTNLDAYPKWQAWMRERRPRLLVIWGKYNPRPCSCTAT